MAQGCEGLGMYISEDPRIQRPRDGAQGLRGIMGTHISQNPGPKIPGPGTCAAVCRRLLVLLESLWDTLGVPFGAPRVTLDHQNE